MKSWQEWHLSRVLLEACDANLVLPEFDDEELLVADGRVGGGPMVP